MDGSHYGNAMTEIALALAMAFFSLMVLTLVSMGAGNPAGPERAADSVPPVTAALAPAPSNARAQAAEPVKQDDQLIIHHQGRFLGADLKAVDITALDPARRIILALDPGLALKDAMTARAKLPSANLVVAPLDARWRDALARLKSGK